MAFKDLHQQQVDTPVATTAPVQTEEVAGQDQFMVEVPKVDLEAVMNDPAVKAVIAQELEQGEESAKLLQDYIADSLKKLFDGQNKNLNQVDEIFEQIVDSEAAKASLKKILQTYKDVDNSSVDTAIRTMDVQMNEMSPLMDKLKTSVESIGGWFSSFRGNAKELFNASLTGIEGRIDTIDMALVNAEQLLNLNEQVLQSEISETAYHIVKHDAMANALSAVLKTLPQGTDAYRLVANLRDRIMSTSGMLRSSFSRLTLISINNENSKLVVKSVKATLWVTLKPLIIENITSGTQAKAYQLEAITMKHLGGLGAQSKLNIQNIMKMEEEGRKALLLSLKTTVDDMDWVLNTAKEHSKNLDVVQAEIDDFIPTFQENVDRLDKGVLEMLESKNSISDAAKLAMENAESLQGNLKEYDAYVTGQKTA